MEYLLRTIVDIALSAGNIIMEIYDAGEPERIEWKSDHSPLTEADRRSHQWITTQLHQRFPDIPVISEESDIPAYEIRRKWKKYWLIDPLDGTKEFLNRNGEFTINIALVIDHQPVAGTICAPAVDVIYWGARNVGVWKQHNSTTIDLLKQPPPRRFNLIAVGSRSHATEAEDQLLDQLGISKIHRIGSALKFGLIAERKADIYYRSSPVWEWDTAAGHALVAAVGGVVLSKGQPLQYNKPILKHPNGFVCLHNPQLLRQFPILARQ